LCRFCDIFSLHISICKTYFLNKYTCQSNFLWSIFFYLFFTYHILDKEDKVLLSLKENHISYPSLYLILWKKLPIINAYYGFIYKMHAYIWNLFYKDISIRKAIFSVYKTLFIHSVRKIDIVLYEQCWNKCTETKNVDMLTSLN
jgi:hypothetical protein